MEAVWKPRRAAAPGVVVGQADLHRGLGIAHHFSITITMHQRSVPRCALLPLLKTTTVAKANGCFRTTWRTISSRWSDAGSCSSSLVWGTSR